MARSLAVLAGVLLSTSFALAQSEPGKQGKPESERNGKPAQSGSRDITRKLYSISHLITPIVAHLAGDQDPAENEQPAEQTSAASENKTLVALILGKVAPASWKQAGGAGTIDSSMDGQVLDVQQTPRVHAELATFLKRIERTQISVDMSTFSVPLRIAEGIRWTTKNGTTFTTFDQESHKEFLQTVRADERTQMLQSPKIMLFDGVSGTVCDCTFKWLLTRVNNQEIGGQKQLVPQYKPIKEGIWCDVLAVASDNCRRVKLNVDFTIREIRRVETSLIQKPIFHDVRVAVTASVPDGRTVAIRAGRTFAERKVVTPSPWSFIPFVGQYVPDNVSYEREPVELILLFTPRIIISEDDDIEVEPLRTPIESVDDGKFPRIVPARGK